MLPKSLIRAKVSALYPTLDKYAISGIVDRIHTWAFSEADLSVERIKGQVECELRHKKTSYIAEFETIADLGSKYYGGARKQFQESARKTLQLKYGV